MWTKNFQMRFQGDFNNGIFLFAVQNTPRLITPYSVEIWIASGKKWIWHSLNISQEHQLFFSTLKFSEWAVCISYKLFIILYLFYINIFLILLY